MGVIVMVKRFCHKYCHPFRDRFVACVAIGLYMFALGAIPALDGYAHIVEPCFECSGPEFEPPAPEEIDPICELVRLSVPFLTMDVVLPSQTGSDSNISFTLFIPTVADTAALPPCRAPPAL